MIEAPILRTVSGQLITRLRERIIAGRYAPGAALLQDEIAADFGVSKIPVREALVQLQGEGLVDIQAHRGFQVRPLSAAECAEIFALRLQVEPAAVAAGARLANDAQREAAAAALAELAAALAAGDTDRGGQLNRVFHLSLVVPALQPVTADALGRLHILAQRYIRLHLSPRGRARRAAREHAAIHAAWTARQHRRAAELTRAHIEATRADLARAVAD